MVCKCKLTGTEQERSVWTQFWLLPFIAIFVVLTSCSSKNATSFPNSAPTTVQSSPTYTAEVLLEGKGRVTSFATYSTDLYWSDEYYEDGLWKYSVTDNADPVLLASRLYSPDIIVVQGNHFYWIDHFADPSPVGKKLLYETTLDGSQTSLLRQGSSLQGTTNQILVDDTAVYWTNGSDYYSTAHIEKVPLDGSSPQTIYTASNGVRAITMDANYIYWLEKAVSQNMYEYTLFRIAKTGGNVETVCQGLIDEGWVLIEPSINMVVDDNFVYLGLSGQVIKIPSAGGSPSVIAQSLEVCPVGLALYGSNLYWLNRSENALSAYGGSEAILSAPTDTNGSFAVIIANLGVSKGLHVSSNGIIWSEDGQIKRQSWGSSGSDTLASGLYFASSDLASGQLYFSEIASSWSYAQIERISVVTGSRETLIGGLNNESASLLPTHDYLVFGDDHALKKVPVNGGKVETLLSNNIFTFNNLYAKDGVIYFSFGGIYKISLDGGSFTLLASDIESSAIISVQDGYVYYTCFWNAASSSPAELHRVAIEGGTPEVMFTVQLGKELLAFDGITTAYLREWIWNDQYKLLKHDIVTGQEIQLYSGRIDFRGMNKDAVFIDDWNGFVYRIPKDGGTLLNILTVPYPLNLDPYWINSGAEDFYFTVSYLDEKLGFFSEISLLKRLQ